MEVLCPSRINLISTATAKFQEKKKRILMGMILLSATSLMTKTVSSTQSLSMKCDDGRAMKREHTAA